MSFEQIIAVLSLTVAALSALSAFFTSKIQHKSAVKLLIKQNQINCYGALIDIAMEIKCDGHSKERTDAFRKHIATAVMLCNFQTYQAIDRCLSELSASSLTFDAISDLIDAVHIEIHSCTIAPVRLSRQQVFKN